MRFLEYERAPRLSCLCSRERKRACQTRLARNYDVVGLQETHGKDEFLQAVQVLVTQFRLLGAFIPNNAYAGGSAFLFVRTSCQTMRFSPT